MDELVAFLDACLTEDERVAKAAYPKDVDDKLAFGERNPELAAKREIFGRHEPYRSEEHGNALVCPVCGPNGEPWPCQTLRILADIYAGRPGWREGWGTGPPAPGAPD